MTDPILQASVILCAYTQERWDDLIAAVDSIRQQETPAGEIIIVVDHNRDLYEMATVQFPDVRVLENREKRGLSGARNTGVIHARYPVVAFMDEDAAAEKDWLTLILSNYGDEQVIGVGGTVEPHWLEKRPDWFPDEFGWVVGCAYKGLPETKKPVRNMLGCNMSFRREMFINVGGFRTSLGRLGGRFLLSCEETEFCVRAKRILPQGRILYDPKVRVNHKVPAYRATWYYYRLRCFAEGLSKALVTDYVGTGDGLESERKYTFRVLPLGILMGIKASILEGKRNGLLRAGAIFAGLLITSIGYLIGRLKARPKLIKVSSPTFS